MANLEAVDAKVERARGHLRRLRDDAAVFCQERSRLILPVRCGDRRWWVYPRGAPSRQVVGACRGMRPQSALRPGPAGVAAGRRPRHLRRPARWWPVPGPAQRVSHPQTPRGRMDVQLCGVGPVAREYIASVQPPRRFREFHALDGNRVGAGLGMLRDLCNQDKHQSCLRARARWTGQWPRELGRASSCPVPLVVEHSHPDHGAHGVVETVGHELRHGRALLITSRWSEWQRLEFPVDAYFDHLPYARGGTGGNASVADVLDACMDSVEMVVSRLRKEL